MAKLKCYECGETFEEEDADCVNECVGEFWGSPAYQSYPVCPFCHSDDIGEDEEPSEDQENDE